MERLFLGVRPASAILMDLVGIQQGVKESGIFGRRGQGRWVPEDNLHLTLHFLGDVSSDQAATVIAALSELRGLSPIGITLDRWLAFPRPDHAKVAGIGSAPDPGATGLFEKSSGALRAAGLVPNPREFVPHLTLVRFPKHARIKSLPDLKSPVKLDISAITLYRSHLRPEGVTYEPLHDFPLADGGTP